MQRFTQTTLGQLRDGDRFSFLRKRNEVWQVTGSTKNNVFINRFLHNGKQVLQYDETKRASTPVVFMRHTKPMPGEDCQLCDLQNGDVFYFLNDVINELLVLRKDAESIVVATADSPQHEGKHSMNETVIFVRHKQNG
jgi:hypothetical protein